MDYWNDIITEKSWKILQSITKLPIKFVLIGGWANYLWTEKHKSKDIDIVTGFEGLKYLKENYDLKKNDHLKKYEITIDEIDIDIYVPYYSQLPIPPEELEELSTKIQNISVLEPEALLVLKQGAEKDREHSAKGEKDRIDIISLLTSANIDFEKYRNLIKKYSLEEYRERLKKIVKEFKEIKYLDMTPREYKKKKEELLKKI